MCLLLCACGGSAASSASPDASDVDAVAIDAAPVSPLGLTCAATSASFAPNPCPPPSGAAGHADFCFRPQWPGVTAVEVYLTDWTTPLVQLTDDGSGTFTGSAALANGSYPYLFRVHGAADRLVRDGQWLLDQRSTAFEPAPMGAPIQRSISVVTVPQTAPVLHHVTGRVVYRGIVQPCFAIDLEVGELRTPQGGVIAEHYTANFAESAADGTFDFEAADGEVGVIVKYPFGLASGYPDPAATPALGVTRTTQKLAGTDFALADADIAYEAADYAALSPIAGTATLPVTFTWDRIASAQSSSVAVIGTNIAGNDPLFWSPFGSATSLAWDGTFGNGAHATLGTTYYWGAWQKNATWTGESLLYPITFH